MATAGRPAYVPLEVYLRTSDFEPDAEYVDGVIEERPLGEYDHSSWSTQLNFGLRNMRGSGRCACGRSCASR